VCPGCVPRGLRPRTEVRWTTLQEGHLAATRPDKFLLMFRFRGATGPACIYPLPSPLYVCPSVTDRQLPRSHLVGGLWVAASFTHELFRSAASSLI
jgi:hypothetical protein